VTKRVYAAGLIVLLSAICLTSIASAQMSWWRAYGGPSDDEGNSVQQTTDGGFIIAGFTNSFGAGDADVYLVKTNAQGETLWTRTYGGTKGDFGYSVQQTSDDGYIIAGTTYSFREWGFGIYLIKTDAQGESLWTRTYGGPIFNDGYSVRQTADGGYIVAGAIFSDANMYDVCLIKTNASGDTLWTRTYGGADEDQARSVQQTTDGGYIAVGSTWSFGAGNGDVYLIKTDAQGETLWTRIYGGPERDEGHSVQQTTDGGYIVTGFSVSAGGLYLIKTDSQGGKMWIGTYAGLGGNSVKQTTDGGYIIAGYGQTDVPLIKTDAKGDTLWTRTYGGTGYDMGYSVQQTTDGGYIVAGYTTSFGAGRDDVYLIKTDADGYVGVEEPSNQRHASTIRFLVRPNPFTSFARVPGHETEFFVLSDVTGRQVAVCKGDRVGEGLRPGVYFLSPVGPRAGKVPTATIVKTAF
jgi:hypothetical protein